MMNLAAIKSIKLSYLGYLFLGILFGVLVLNSIFVALFAMLAIAIVLLISDKPLQALTILIFIIPFSNTILFRGSFISIPGAKPLQLLAMFVLTIAIINHEKGHKMPRFAAISTWIIVIFFTISVYRSLSYLSVINMITGIPVSVSTYLLANYIKPLIYLMPFVLVIKFPSNFKELDRMINVMIFAVGLLSIYFLYLYVFEVPNKFDFGAVSQYTGGKLGMHRNSVANFFIVGVPFIMSRFFIKRDMITMILVTSTVVAVGFLYSRTAYALLLFDFVFYLFISKRAKLLPVLAIIGFLVSFVISDSIVERASKGFDEGDANKISAGRIDTLWKPLLEEHLARPFSFLTGDGRYSVAISDAVEKGVIEGALHPHNMFLEQIFESGIFSLMTFFIFFGMIVKKCFAKVREEENPKIREYLFACITAIVAYFIAGLSGRSLIPELSNGYFWLVAGYAVALVSLPEEVLHADGDGSGKENKQEVAATVL